MEFSKEVNKILKEAFNLAKKNNNLALTAEHLFLAITKEKIFNDVFKSLGGNIDFLSKNLEKRISELDKSNGSTNMILANNYKDTLSLASIDSMLFNSQKINMINLSFGLFINGTNGVQKYLIEQKIAPTVLVNKLAENYGFNDSEVSESSEIEDKPWKKFVTDIRMSVLKDNFNIIGRQLEIEDTIRILCRKEKSNALHIGEAGVGKTSIVLGLAKLINDGKVPEKLKNNKIYSLNMGVLLSGTKFRGEFEERITSIISGLEEEENCILYIDEIHSIVGMGATEGSLDMSNILKPALISGKFKVIGTTTYNEYKKYFEKDKALSRRFKAINVLEPTKVQTIEILNGIKSKYENFHKVTYTTDAIESMVDLSVKFINNKFLPDKAIDLMDEAGAYYSQNNTTGNKKKVTSNLIEKLISINCNIPLKSITKKESSKLLSMEDNLSKVIFGQKQAISETIKAIKLNRTGLVDCNKPIASLLFVGPTGVGKTEIAKQISNEMDIPLIRYDMSEYSEPHSVAKLIGTPPGYVGFEDGGKLIDDIIKHPNCVLLLDEIEKAHSTLFNVLLQIMDYATLTDSKGRKADFKNVLLIMTSNAGATFVKQKGLGFNSSLETINRTAMNDEVNKLFSPEFRNRLTKIIPFNFMDETMASNIVNRELNSLKDLLLTKNIKLKYNKDLFDFIKNKGISEEYGAREIIRTIDNEVKPLFMDVLLSEDLKTMKTFTVNMIDNKPSL